MLYGRKNTKANREAAREGQFNYMTGAGWSRETYKGLEIFTKDEGKYFTLKVFWGTAAAPDLKPLKTL